MYLSIPALKEIVVDIISKKTKIPRDLVREVLESDGPWTDHDRFLINTFMTAQQQSRDPGVDFSAAVGGMADLTELGINYPAADIEDLAGDEACFNRSEKVVEASKETGQPLETVKAINSAYFEFVDNVAAMMKMKLRKDDPSY